MQITNMRRTTHLFSIAVLGLFIGVQYCHAQPATTNKPKPQKLSSLKKTVIPPLTPSAKLLRVKQILGGKIGSKTLDHSSINDAVSLSVASPVSGDNTLDFWQPYQVSPSANAASFASSKYFGTSYAYAYYWQVGLVVTFKAPADGTYIFDIAGALTGGPTTTNAHLDGYFNSIATSQVSPQDKHIILVAQNVKAGPAYYRVSVEDASWTFTSVTISQLKY